MKTVILIHGLHMRSFHFLFMRKALRKDPSLEVLTLDYESRGFSDKALLDLKELVDGVAPENDIALVGHSLGGLVSRLYLDKFKPQRNIKLITLGTPHQGSLVAKNIDATILKPLLGSSTEAGLTRKIAPWDGAYPLVSIAGVKKFGVAKLFAKGVAEDSDGTVFVSETMLDRATKHVVLDDVHHFQLLAHKKSIAEVQHWI